MEKDQTSLKERNVMIKLENINKYYQSGDERVHALKNINLELPYKGLVFVLGQSGCGKSTLLNVLGGLDKPEEGRILIEGADFSKFTSSDHNNYLNSYLGFIFQEYNILKDLNLYDNIALPLEMQHVDKKEIKKRTNEIIDLVGLTELKKRKINQLSGGQRQRIAVARALIKNPKLIIADEPTGNLDSVTGATIFELLKTLSQDRLIVIVSHDEESAYKYGDRIIKIEDGTLIEDINYPFDNDSNPLLQFNGYEDIEIAKVESLKANDKPKNENSLVLTKVSAPLKTSFKIALKNINHKKFRFILMMFICALSLAFFSFTIELNDATIRQNIYTSVENGYVYADVLQKSELPEGYIKTSIYDDYIGTNLEAGSYEDVRKASPGLNIHEYRSVAISVTQNANDRLINSFYTGEIEYLTKYDSRNTYNLICGREPIEGKHEIMLTDYMIEMFKYFDKLDIENNYSNYIGKYITLGTNTKYRICGITNTNFEKYIKFMQSPSIDVTNKLYYAFLNEYKAMNTVYLDSNDYTAETSVIMYKIDIHKSNLSVSIKGAKDGQFADISDMSVTTKPLNIKGIATTSGVKEIGNQLDNTKNQIVIPYSLYAALFNLEPGEPSDYGNYSTLWRKVRNKTVTIQIQTNDKPLEIEAEVVGISETTNITANTIGISDAIMEFIFNNGPKTKAALLAEMSPFGRVAYNDFKKAYNAGYVIDIFAYRADIDSYEISPFINLLSKAGLFVFAVFTIGILWTIISLDIVDSKKEIGTFRSIGLSGGKVSLIFIIQTLIICSLSYIIALILGNYAIKLYDSTLYDNLHVIRLSMYMMTYRSPVYLVIFLLVITTLALFLPLSKIMRQKIIDVINERGDL